MRTYIPNETESQAIARGLTNLKDLIKMIRAKGKSYDPRIDALENKISDLEFKLY